MMHIVISCLLLIKYALGQQRRLCFTSTNTFAGFISDRRSITRDTYTCQVTEICCRAHPTHCCVPQHVTDLWYFWFGMVMAIIILILCGCCAKTKKTRVTQTTRVYDVYH